MAGFAYLQKMTCLFALNCLELGQSPQGIPDITVDRADQVEVLAETPWEEKVDLSNQEIEISVSESCQRQRSNRCEDSRRFCFDKR